MEKNNRFSQEPSSTLTGLKSAFGYLIFFGLLWGVAHHVCHTASVSLIETLSQ